MTTPKQEYQWFGTCGKSLDGGVREWLPAFVLMGGGLSFADGQNGVQQHDALSRPRRQIDRLRNRTLQILRVFL